jgi:asparagine synthase (glutamine-hydrolysing)
MPDIVPRLGSILDEPIGDASILPTVVLSRFARERVTVALGGDGGDELFAGYPMHQAHRVAAAARALPTVAIRGAANVVRRLPVTHGNFTFAFKAATFLRGAAAEPPVNHALWMSSFPPSAHSDILTDDMMAGAQGNDPLDAFHRRWLESAGAPLLARATHLDATTYLPNDILTKVDRASMSVALEVRAPFLARDIVEFAFSLPDSYRMRGLRGKRILRDAVRDLLPPAIIRRPKKGFGMPVGAWLNGSLRDLTNDLLAPAAVRDAGFFRPSAIARLLDEHHRHVADHRKPLWTLLMFELWRRAQVTSRLQAARR